MKRIIVAASISSVLTLSLTHCATTTPTNNTSNITNPPQEIIYPTPTPTSNAENTAAKLIAPLT